LTRIKRMNNPQDLRRLSSPIRVELKVPQVKKFKEQNIVRKQGNCGNKKGLRRGRFFEGICDFR
jgi:hypothetical protein